LGAFFVLKSSNTLNLHVLPNFTGREKHEYFINETFTAGMKITEKPYFKNEVKNLPFWQGSGRCFMGEN
jgi:hypothetical protein